MSPKKVAVLLATYNGSAHLRVQLNTLLAQTHKNIHIFIRDDGSEDQTMEIIDEYSRNYKNITLIISNTDRGGSACANFIEMIRGMAVGDFDYFSLSDQDDIWTPDKITRALGFLDAGYDCYASNLIAFTDDGKRVWIVDKAQDQTGLDYMFQGASAGCTYVFSARVFEMIKNTFYGRPVGSYKHLSHDWLIYAISRSAGFKWFIDPISKIFYRQHSNNVYGDAGFFNGYLKKLAMINSGWYLKNINDISQFLVGKESEKKYLDLVKNKNIFKRMKIINDWTRLRRKKLESLFVVLVVVLGLMRD
ncbi:glycosyltransferase [Limnohabitans lacus]|uniref:Glycosyltransferase n=1 Tax=Limnohabitans lacus TaxID=3045173 RepID=A0ABT6X3N7_9BURK|nr:glycosyltransferase [Limnohabitans sp. HM2-2]MDI9232733.1 glycosyltransferase [Limnohabitans sp. HM2-2]